MVTMKYYSEIPDYRFKYAKPGDAGLDLPVTSNISLAPGDSVVARTGIYLEIPEGYYGKIDTRSSTGIKKVDVLTRTVDQGYRGEVKLALINHSDKTINWSRGDRVGQIVILPFLRVELEPVQNLDELAESERGSSWNGSSGK